MKRLALAFLLLLPAYAQQSKRPDYCRTCERDSQGRIKRSPTARKAFMRKTGYPNGRPGYRIDHIIPLACGGKDELSNMQWLTIEQKKAKDKVERKGCTV